MAADEVRPASAKRQAVKSSAATERGESQPILRLSPNHPEADHKPSLGRETNRKGVESALVAHKQLADARFSDEPKPAFHDAAGLGVPSGEEGGRPDAHQVSGAAREHAGVRIKLAPDDHVDIARPSVVDVDLFRRAAEIGDH